MSLKKQVKEQKAEIIKKDEELITSKKNIKNTKFYEMDQEMKLYKDELIRLRYLLESAYSSNAPMGESMQNTSRPSVTNAYTHGPITFPQSQN
jgi:thioesterase domain-containing protein